MKSNSERERTSRIFCLLYNNEKNKISANNPEPEVFETKLIIMILGLCYMQQNNEEFRYGDSIYSHFTPLRF